MPAGMGKIVLMGSGELTSTMVEVHKMLLNQLTEPPRAAFLDTPAGFQLNADQISHRAAEYFRIHIQHPLQVASFKSNSTLSELEKEKALHTLRRSNYVLVGPGSPTYAVRQWQGTPIKDILIQCIQRGGCFVAASAASLTVGRFTMPVYEIYKVGQEVYWVEGLDILGAFGFNLVVIPHWNNAEGGNHDTRFCFVGEPRLRLLQDQLPEEITIVGMDEHTACILDLERDEAEVKGIGQVTLRTKTGDICFNTGERFTLDVLRGDEQATVPRPASTRLTPTSSDRELSQGSGFWEGVHAIESSFKHGVGTGDITESTNALLELDRLLWQAQVDLESEESITQARDMYRELIVLLGTEFASTSSREDERLTLIVESLLKLRHVLRGQKQYAQADAIRELLHEAHIAVEDEEDGGYRWSIRE